MIAVHMEFFPDLYAKLQASGHVSVTPKTLGDVKLKRCKGEHNAVA